MERLFRGRLSDYPDKDIEIRVESDDATFYGSDVDLREILLNLGNNSIDAIDSGGTITIQCQQLDAQVCFIVSDDGSGMAPDVLARCLDPFYSTKEGRGSGLGLASSNAIVSSYGGKLTVESEPGHGCTIAFTLPSQSSIKTENADTTRGTDRTLRSNRILLVEDSQLTRESITLVFESLGQQVVNVDSPNALTHLRDHDIDVVLTDFRMPQVDGFQLAMSIRNEFPGVPIIMMSGYEEPGARECCDVFIKKPIALKTIQNALASLPRSAT